MKIQCPHCGESITVTKSQATEALRQHEKSCTCTECEDVPLSVRKLRTGEKSLLKVKGTEFDPGKSFESAKDNISNIAVINDELQFPVFADEARCIADMIIDLEKRMKTKLLWN